MSNFFSGTATTTIYTNFLSDHLFPGPIIKPYFGSTANLDILVYTAYQDQKA